MLIPSVVLLALTGGVDAGSTPVPPAFEPAAYLAPGAEARLEAAAWALSPRGDLLAVLTLHPSGEKAVSTIRLFRFPSLTPVRTVQHKHPEYEDVGEGPLLSLAYSPGGAAVMAFVGDYMDLTEYVLRVADGKVVFAQRDMCYGYPTVTFSGDGSTFQTMQDNDSVSGLYDARTGERRTSVRRFFWGGKGLEGYQLVEHDGGMPEVVAYSDALRSVVRWRAKVENAIDGQLVSAADPTGRYLAIHGRDEPARLLDAQTGAVVGASSQLKSISQLNFAPDGKHLFANDADHLLVFALPNLQQVFAGTAEPMSVTFATAGRELAWVSNGPGVQIEAIRLPQGDSSSPVTPRRLMTWRGVFTHFDNLRSAHSQTFSAGDVLFFPLGVLGVGDALPHSSGNSLGLVRLTDGRALLLAITADGWVALRDDGAFDGAGSGLALVKGRRVRGIVSAFVEGK